MPDYHLYTIPIWDAYKRESECALCELHRSLEAQYLDAALGGGMMESDIRLETNRQGFCPKHLSDLYGMQQVLPLALTLHTHFQDVLKDAQEGLDALEAAIAQEAGLAPVKKAVRYVARGGDVGQAADALAQTAQSRAQGCHICGKIQNNIVRYVDALLHMWQDDREFRAAFDASKGACMLHLPLLLSEAARKLAGEKRREFLSSLAKMQRDNLERIEKELEWFTLKFDYRNTDKPWGNSKDAVPRAMLKLRGPDAEGGKP